MGGGAHQGGFIQDLLDRIPTRHSGGPGLNKDEVLMKVLRNEYVLNPRATRSIGKGNLDYMNQTGQVPAGLTIANHFDLTPDLLKNKRFLSTMRTEQEATARKVVREYV